MSEIANLRRARKHKRRAEHETAAKVNRAAFGRTKTERHAAEAERGLVDRRLDGHRLDRDDDR